MEIRITHKPMLVPVAGRGRVPGAYVTVRLSRDRTYSGFVVPPEGRVDDWAGALATVALRYDLVDRLAAVATSAAERARCHTV